MKNKQHVADCTAYQYHHKARGLETEAINVGASAASYNRFLFRRATADVGQSLRIATEMMTTASQISFAIVLEYNGAVTPTEAQDFLCFGTRRCYSSKLLIWSHHVVALTCVSPCRIRLFSR